ncbi:DUF547 domain-containing protein [Hymenobacter psychrophilus]|uniref:DUF547 domain-containing protein n=1 Tax=Hymenobacter psychrophilus TaxID=651662 RepID=A0A1H3D850_9BACT|nr:DUF547 domain-containing protein [Hymenobacter psychrophilus]SDX62506.1 Protein of unknown function, DUF547 [Hymenobacter psychrophilus]
MQPISRFTSRLALGTLLAAGTLASAGCGYVGYLIPLNPTSQDGPTLDHSAWDGLLKKYVDDQGMVNYKGFRQDSAALNSYLKTLSDNLPAKKSPADEKLAYWINAYNAFTVQRIIRAYPVKSIKDLGGDKIFVDTVWDQDFISLGGKRYTLNDIEHRIIRKQFDDNRIHYALVCAAMSCPRLRNEAFVGRTVQEQLAEQGRDFINNPQKNDLTPAGQPTLSAIYSFYPKDFEKNGSTSIQDAVNRYAKQKIDPNAKISYKEYNWSLNEQ